MCIYVYMPRRQLLTFLQVCHLKQIRKKFCVLESLMCTHAGARTWNHWWFSLHNQFYTYIHDQINTYLLTFYLNIIFIQLWMCASLSTSLGLFRDQCSKPFFMSLLILSRYSKFHLFDSSLTLKTSMLLTIVEKTLKQFIQISIRKSKFCTCSYNETLFLI